MDQPSQNSLRHVAIIMDGNGRWARQRGFPRIEGHRRGVDNVREIIKVAREVELEHLTLFAFSVENWQRPSDEIASLMDLLELFLKRNLKDLLRNEVRLNVIGRPEELPERVQKPLQKALDETAHFEGRQLNVALNYGSRTEVLDAVRAYAEAVAEGREDPRRLDWPHFERYLYTHGIPDPDLLIRTSGESRISNFLLMQCAYSELYFSPVFWPEFGREHFLEAVECYRQRERRFGKTGEQVQKAPSHAIANS
ncbi:MAG: isoprenyl transferase [Puniceicoccales bacterium]